LPPREPPPLPAVADVSNGSSAQFTFKGGLTLNVAQTRLLERLFKGCASVMIAKLHGGFSGSLVLTADSHGADGKREEPTVCKLDSADEMSNEVVQTKTFGELVGSDAIRIVRGPLYASADGQAKEESTSADDYGAVLLEMAGACWVLPEFYGAPAW
jgi:hypothetical protein